jgi:hypothetical protein
MTSDKLLINDTCDQAGAVDKASASSSLLSVASSDGGEVRELKQASAQPRCSANPFLAGVSAAANATATLFRVSDDDADNILHVDGAIEQADPVTNLRLDCKLWLKVRAQ